MNRDIIECPYVVVLKDARTNKPFVLKDARDAIATFSCFDAAEKCLREAETRFHLNGEVIQATLSIGRS